MDGYLILIVWAAILAILEKTSDVSKEKRRKRWRIFMWAMVIYTIYFLVSCAIALNELDSALGELEKSLDY